MLPLVLPPDLHVAHDFTSARFPLLLIASDVAFDFVLDFAKCVLHPNVSANHNSTLCALGVGQCGLHRNHENHVDC